MSEHALPDDPAAWPRDPFRLLGVSPGASERELRKAYHSLIRKYKPEHAPEEFRRIREAYEFAQRAAESLGSLLSWMEEEEVEELSESSDVETDASINHVAEPRSSQSAESPSRDAWEVACDGAEAEAYRELVARVERGHAPEEIYLQLYWLCVVAPELDRGREPSTWLMRGLAIHGRRAFRVFELLRRELEIDKTSAVRARFAQLLSRDSQPDLALAFAKLRWRAARELGAWQAILSDVQTLREWVPERDPECWVRLLLCAAANLIWSPLRGAAASFRRAADLVAAEHSFDIDHELSGLEYAAAIMSGLSQLAAPADNLRRLLALSWDDPDLEAQRRVMAFLRGITREPYEALERLTELQRVAPAALGRLAELVDQPRHQALEAEVVEEVEIFLSATRWYRYAEFRAELLQFCIHRAIAPAAFAQAIAKRWEYEFHDKRHLSAAISDDWPLLLIHRACELTWQ